MAREISERARQKFDAIAVALYGSVARDEDGPYSDIDILCVTPDETDKDYVWLHDGWNIEVNARDRATLLRRAAAVTRDWPVSHANYLYLLPFHDPNGLFQELKVFIEAVPAEDFEHAIASVLRELYGAMSKIRNARNQGNPAIPGFVHYVVRLGYSMIGLANRRTFSTATQAVQESLVMDDRPAGYDALCRMTTASDLTDDMKTFDACESFWRGAAAWAEARGINLESSKHLI